MTAGIAPTVRRAVRRPPRRARAGEQDEYGHGEHDPEPVEGTGRRSGCERGGRAERGGSAEPVLDAFGEVQDPDDDEHEGGKVEVGAADPLGGAERRDDHDDRDQEQRQRARERREPGRRRPKHESSDEIEDQQRREQPVCEVGARAREGAAIEQRHEEQVRVACAEAHVQVGKPGQGGIPLRVVDQVEVIEAEVVVVGDGQGRVRKPEDRNQADGSHHGRGRVPARAGQAPGS